MPFFIAMSGSGVPFETHGVSSRLGSGDQRRFVQHQVRGVSRRHTAEAVGNTREHRQARNLVSVQMQDGQHGIADRIEKLVRVPTSGERRGFRFAIAVDARDELVGIVERGTEGVG